MLKVCQLSLMATTIVKIQTNSGLLIFDASCVSDILYLFDVSYVLDVLEQIVFFHRTEEACVSYLLQNE